MSKIGKIDKRKHVWFVNQDPDGMVEVTLRDDWYFVDLPNTGVKRFTSLNKAWKATKASKVFYKPAVGKLVPDYTPYLRFVEEHLGVRLKSKHVVWFLTGKVIKFLLPSSVNAHNILPKAHLPYPVVGHQEHYVSGTLEEGTHHTVIAVGPDKRGSITVRIKTYGSYLILRNAATQKELTK